MRVRAANAFNPFAKARPDAQQEAATRFLLALCSAASLTERSLEFNDLLISNGARFLDAKNHQTFRQRSSARSPCIGLDCLERAGALRMSSDGHFGERRKSCRRATCGTADKILAGIS